MIENIKTGAMKQLIDINNDFQHRIFENSDAYKKLICDIKNEACEYITNIQRNIENNHEELNRFIDDLENKISASLLNNNYNYYYQISEWRSQFIPNFNQNIEFKDFIKVGILTSLFKKFEFYLNKNILNLTFDFLKTKTLEQYNHFIKNFYKKSIIKTKIGDNEKKLIREGKLIFKLWSTLGQNSLSRWLKNTEKDTDSGCILIKNYKIIYDLSVYKKYKKNYFNSCYTNSNNPQFGDVLSANFFEDPELIKFPLELFMQLTGKNRENSIEILAYDFGIDITETFSPLKIDNRQKWRQIQIDGNEIKTNESGLTIPFKPSKGKQTNTSIGLVKYNSEQNCYLPESHWQKDGTNKILKLSIPFIDKTTGKFPILNQDLINDHKSAKIILTNNLLFAFYAQDSTNKQFIFTSWYGGYEALENVSFNIIRKREIIYLILYENEDDLKQEYKIAYYISKQLKDSKISFIKTKIELICSDNETSKLECQDQKLMPFDSFQEEAERILEISREIEAIPIEKIRIKPKTLSELSAERQRNFILSPLLLDRSVTLIYSPPNVGKTWLAMSIAYAISIGGRFFYTWKAKYPKKILYIDNEMDSAAFNNRIKIIEKINFHVSPKKLNDNKNNFLVILKKHKLFNLDFDDFLKEVIKFVVDQKIRLVVLDNLSSFTKHNDSATAWEKINSWLTELQTNGCSSLVVHHANRNKTQRGTSAKTNTADNVIKLHMPAELNCKQDSKKNPDLAFEIQIEKGRDVYGFSRQKMFVEFFANLKKPYWKLLTTKNETDIENEIILDLIERGVSNKEIQNILGWGKSKLISRKEKINKKRGYRKKTI